MFNASSSECFGDTNESPADELTPFHPRSPYAVAKAAAYWQVVNYRAAYNIFSCSGVLFNHESPLRPNRFVTQKIIQGVCDIYHKKSQKIKLGNLAIVRDWGWAPEYVEAMHLMLQQNQPEDFVIATGKSLSLMQFIEITFDYFNLDYKRYIELDGNLLRPSEIMVNSANPQGIYDKLNWKAKIGINEIVRSMIDHRLQKTAQKAFPTS